MRREGLKPKSLRHDGLLGLRPYRWLWLLAGGIVALAGCGPLSAQNQPGATATHPAREASTRTPPVASRPLRFDGRPVVVAFLNASPPGYTVLFRLNRPLPPGGSVVVSLDGERDYDLSGTGVSESAGRGCYAWGLTRVRGLPRSLSHPSVGHPLRVEVKLKARSATILSASVTPQAPVVADGEPGIASDDRLGRLGCSG